MLFKIFLIIDLVVSSRRLNVLYIAMINYIISITIILAITCHTVNGEIIDPFQIEVTEQIYVKIPEQNGKQINLEKQDNEDFNNQIKEDTGNEYWLFTRDNPNHPQILKINNFNSILTSNFQPHRRTMIIAHGGFHNGHNEPNPILRKVYLGRQDANIITVDWSHVAQNNYITAVRGVPEVGRAVGDFINFLHNNFGLSLDNIHLVGFSLGAHLVGVAGRRVGGRIARVTGLDPAGPLWLNNNERMSPQDGIYVEAIHTDGGYPGPGIGIGRHIVQVDFFPNGGISQPGCFTNVCNHNRAYELFAASLVHNHLIGRFCENYAQVGWNACTGVSLLMGGDDLRKTGTPGRYRVNTQATYPF